MGGQGEERITETDAGATLRLLYEETGRVAAAFLEWRHKVILLCSAILTLAFGAVSWMFTARLSGVVMAIPLLFGSFVAAACRAFDRRNGQILDDCFKAGRELEGSLGLHNGERPPEGIYTRILRTREDAGSYNPRAHTYGWTLRRGYLIISAALLVLAVAVFALGVATPHFLLPFTHG